MNDIKKRWRFNKSRNNERVENGATLRECTVKSFKLMFLPKNYHGDFVGAISACINVNMSHPWVITQLRKRDVHLSVCIIIYSGTSFDDHSKTAVTFWRLPVTGKTRFYNAGMRSWTSQCSAHLVDVKLLSFHLVDVTGVTSRDLTLRSLWSWYFLTSAWPMTKVPDLSSLPQTQSHYCVSMLITSCTLADCERINTL